MTLESPKKTIKRKRSASGGGGGGPLTANKIKRSVADLEESYKQPNEEQIAEAEESEEMPHFESVEGLLMESEDVKPVITPSQRPSVRDFEFPLTKYEQVNALEEEIGLPNSQIRKQLIETIHTIQGNIKDHRVTIRTFLKVIFTDQLLGQYTWKGFENKQALCQYKNLITFLKKILIRWFPDDDLSDFAKVIQNYIKNVPSRLQRTKKEDD